MSGIEVAHLTVSYGFGPVVSDVGFQAAAGEVTGLIGPNGAGKSTVVKAVLGLLQPDAGSVHVDGRAAGASNGRHVAYLPQRSDLDVAYPVQVRELVTMGRLPHRGLWGRRQAADRNATTRAIGRVGLSGLERRQLGTLSGGQQQRAHLARALAQEPRAYVLDEPFTGIDAPTAELLGQLIGELAAEGAAVLLVNHDLDQLADMCHRLVLLNETVLADGGAHEVLVGPMIARAYRQPRPTPNAATA